MSPSPSSSGRTMFWLVLKLLLLATACTAQQPSAFQWRFNDNTSNSFKACQNLSLSAFPNEGNGSSVGVPPYYLYAYELGGPTTVHYIGTDNNSLSWQVDHKPGTQLMLAMGDSLGNSGGVGSIAYAVVDGDTSCLPSDSNTSFVMSSNITKETSMLKTCEPWQLSIQGGSPPYTVTLAALSSHVVTNVSLAEQNNVLIYIDRADPGSQILAAVHDSNGQWGIGTNIVHTTGSADVDCPGLVTFDTNEALLQQQQAQIQSSLAAASAARNNKIKIIIGVCVPIGALSLLLVLFLFLRKRRRTATTTTERKAGPGPSLLERIFGPPKVDTRPRAFEVEEVESVSSKSESGSGRGGGHYTREKTLPDVPQLHVPDVYPYPSLNTQTSAARASLTSPPSRHPFSSTISPLTFASDTLPPIREHPSLPPNHSLTRSQSATFSPPSERRYNKTLELMGSRRSVDILRRYGSASAASPWGRPRPDSVPSRPHTADASIPLPGEREIVIQHQDAAAVREVPPPYVDYRPSGSPQEHPM